MKHTRRRRHLRPRPTRSQIHDHLRAIRQYELALEVLRVEVAFELKRPEPSAARIRCFQERADKLLALIASKEAAL